MPALAHLALGCLFAILLYNTNPKRFTRKHAIIFALNSYIGPDLVGIIGLGTSYALGHSVLGWPIYAIWLVPIYTFLTRFTADSKHLQLVDQGPNNPERLQWWQVYLLVVAGGLFHFSVDVTFETKNWWSWGMESHPWKASMENFWVDLYIKRPMVLDIGIAVEIFGILCYCLMNKYMKEADQTNNRRKANGIVILFVTVYTVLLYAFGIGLSGNEADLGTMAYFLIFYFTPFFLCLLAFRPENYQPKPKKYDDSKGVMKLKIIISFFLVIPILFLTVVIVFSFYWKTHFAELLPDANTTIINFLVENFLLLAGALILISALFLLAVFLLVTRKPFAQRYCMVLLVLIGIAVFPLVFWGLLREKEVLAQFPQKSSIELEKKLVNK